MIIRSVYTAVFFMLMCSAWSQQPVQWSFRAEKVKANEFKLFASARIQEGYHLFALQQPDDAIAMPTKIVINSSSEIDLAGPFRAEGQMEKVRDSVLEIEAWQFSRKVDFINSVILKNNRYKVTITGYVEYQVCSDDQCYPPTRLNFSLPLNH
jgi:hypothetical protein